MTRWIDPPVVQIPSSFADLDLHPLVAQTLVRRGITSAADARAFLHADVLPSTRFPEIEKAVDVIRAVIKKGGTICVWGDFDVDGQTSTTLLVQTLRALNAGVVHYIPIRGKESHGVHIETLEPIISNGAKLILTCDTGITAHQAVEYANARGADVVITDHHDLGETLPTAKAIVNPKLLPKDHLLANLAGVGVAYKLAEALLEDEALSKGLLDLVALGLIADVALLKGETRSLVQKGIQVLRYTDRTGLKVMSELSSTSLETLTEETIGFTFAPRLNALGRLSDANPSVELLLTQDPARARVLAAQVEGLNAQRRLLTSQVYEAAEAQLRENPSLFNEPAIILSDPSWPGGVVGIVANRLVERHHKPAILMNISEDGVLRGSARSIEGLHITEAISSQKDLLLGFGGHPMAAGLSMNVEMLTRFRKGLGRAIEKQMGATVREEPVLEIDAWLNLDEVGLALADTLETLAPFGAGNPTLTFATRNVQLKSVSTIGKTKEHIRITVEDEGGALQSILWWSGAGEELPEQGAKFDIAYSMRASTFRGEKQVTLQFEDFRVVEKKPIEVKRTLLELEDHRMESTSALVQLQQRVPGLQIWAEGSDRSRGRTRNELIHSTELAIYTTPSSPAELRKVMEAVQPRKVHLFAVPPGEEKPEDFLNRLTGLCKYALNQRAGKTTIQELSAGMAAREATVRLGLEWLGASGQVQVRVDADQVTLSSERTDPSPYLQSELFIALKGSLNEAAAYRKYFATAEAGSLFK
jgi:single-stranded-DNA-specific exonuclease